jgi:hypothetical protein
MRRPLTLEIKNPSVLGSSWNLNPIAIEGLIDASSKNYRKRRNTLWQSAEVLKCTAGGVLVTAGP